MLGHNIQLPWRQRPDLFRADPSAISHRVDTTLSISYNCDTSDVKDEIGPARRTVRDTQHFACARHR
uniref:Uncharacterized protein n=1 Tax=Hyaloperonospora arabidopsidis (strain Emoy2) TaxID=559515 RepID=M4BHK7_HYAAE